jgi:mono/diheme cytochrome c family protein
MPNFRPVCAIAACMLASIAAACAPSRAATPPETVPQPRLDTPVARGEWVFSVAGCTLCHGQGGKGGVRNLNSDTGGKINGLTLVKESYSADELAQKIREGVRQVGRANPHGPAPPLRMPEYGKLLPDREIKDVVAYLFSIYPKGRAKDDSWGDDDSGDDDDSKPTTKAGAKPGKSARPDKAPDAAKPAESAKPSSSESDDDDDAADHPREEQKHAP